MLALVLVGLVAGCAGDDESGLGSIGYVEGFFGGVAADEPQAVLIGRDVLSAGGTAADAVVAMYFASAVTLPSSASLGGGGVCVAFDSDKRTVAAVDFLPRAPLHVPPEADRPTAVPGSVRGFFLLHARFGRLRWTEVVAPAEHLARFGFQVSRALARDIERVERGLWQDAEFRRVFAAPGGERLVGEGDFLRQVELASVLGNIRGEGAGGFYSGHLALRVAEATQSAGGSLDVSDLRDFTPTLRETIRVPFGDAVAHFAPPPAAGGVSAAQMFELLLEDGYGTASAERRGLLLAEATARIAADRARWMQPDGSSDIDPQSLVAEARLETVAAGGEAAALRLQPENPAAATFIAFDRKGSAAACAVTLNSLFGTGRIAPGTGIVLAAAPGPGGRGFTALGPMLIVNDIVGEFFFAGASSGGVAAPAALAQVAVRVMAGEDTLAAAVRAGRVLGGVEPGRIYHEHGFGGVAEEALAARGYRLAATPELGRVNAGACRGGIPPRPQTCEVATDPRGFGLALGGE